MLFIVKLSAAIILTRVNPAVLNVRGAKQTMSVRERIFFSVFIPSSLALPIVAGLDVGGSGWSHRSMSELVIGLGFVLAGTSLVEPTVRIQSDREQTVCTSGSYRVVRHPGYTVPSWRPQACRSRWARAGASCRSP